MYTIKYYITKVNYQVKLGKDAHVGECMEPQNEVGYSGRSVNDYNYLY